MMAKPRLDTTKVAMTDQYSRYGGWANARDSGALIWCPLLEQQKESLPPASWSKRGT